MIALFACAGGCAGQRLSTDLTLAGGGRSVQARQSTPTEIQGLVMAFADKYAARAATTLDEVHDRADSIEVRRYAREAKVSAGWGAVTIATEINPVASLLDMVTMVRLKRMSFAEHGAQSLPPEPARLIREMHELSEREVWDVAGRFLTEIQMTQLRGVIDEWYRQNSSVRMVAHLKMLDFASFRRESAVGTRNAPSSVLALLALDPLASFDPVQRELQESRLFAERTLFFAKRVPPMGFWQFQLASVDLLVTPEVRDLLDRSEWLSAASARLIGTTERFAATSEQFAAQLERMPDDVDRIAATAIADLHGRLSEERAAAIEQVAVLADAQRSALTDELARAEGAARGVISDVNRTLAEARVTAAAVSDSAQHAAASVQVNLEKAIDLAFRRVLTLFLIVLVSVPAVLLLYRFFAARLPAPGSPRRAD